MGKTEKIILYSFLAIMLIVVQILIRYFRSKKDVKSSKEIGNLNIINQPRFYFYVGLTGLIVFTAGGIYALVTENEPYYILIFILDIPYVFFILVQLNWKIEICKNKFIFRNMWGMERSYDFNDIEFRELAHSTRFYKRNKYVVSISHLQDNWDSLQNFIKIYKKN